TSCSSSSNKARSRRTLRRSREPSIRVSPIRIARIASTARGRLRYCHRVSCRSRAGVRAFSLRKSREETCKANSHALSTTRRHNCFGGMRNNPSASSPLATPSRKLAMNRIGVAIVGVNGAVATTVIAGVDLMKRGLVPRVGMVTERADARIAESITELLDFAPLESMVFAGWDLQFANVYEGALHHKVLPQHVLEQVRADLEKITPWPAVFSSSYVEKLAGKNVVVAKGHREEVAILE